MKELLDVDTVVRATIAGHSARSIASRHECSIEQVREVLDEFSRKTLSPSNRSMVLALECSRLEMLEARFFKKAIEEGDSTAGTLVVKVSQRRAALLGLDQPAAIRMDITAVTEHEDETATAKMLAVVRRLRDESTPDETNQN